LTVSQSLLPYLHILVEPVKSALLGPHTLEPRHSLPLGALSPKAIVNSSLYDIATDPAFTLFVSSIDRYVLQSAPGITLKVGKQAQALFLPRALPHNSAAETQSRSASPIRQQNAASPRYVKPLPGQQ
jgi:hypothetical protein